MRDNRLRMLSRRSDLTGARGGADEFTGIVLLHEAVFVVLAVIHLRVFRSRGCTTEQKRGRSQRNKRFHDLSVTVRWRFFRHDPSIARRVCARSNVRRLTLRLQNRYLTVRSPAMPETVYAGSTKSFRLLAASSAAARRKAGSSDDLACQKGTFEGTLRGAAAASS